MEPDKNTQTPAEGNQQTSQEQSVPTDALSRTPEELSQEHIAKDPSKDEIEKQVKKLSPIKRLFKKVNIYFLIFILLAVIGAIITIVTYINSQKVPPEPSIATQELDEDALKQLANTNATVGDAAQTLAIQGNAVIAGQTLLRSDLNVASNLQTGGSIQGPSITISGSANLGATQVSSLQVANNVAIQGSTTMRDLSVSGTSSFSGAITASQITVSRLILSGNGALQIPNHISFIGSTPTRNINASVLGSGGSASVNGSDTAGTVNINTGNSPSAGCMIRINFQRAYSAKPRVIISPSSAGAGRTQYYVERTPENFNICSINVPPANEVLVFDYFITN